MTREEIKRRAELYSALEDGKTIQILNMEGNWVDVEVKKLNYIPETLKFRIKPKSNYRPFETQGECWNEMLKHQPFGWVKSKKSERLFSIGSVFWDNNFNDVSLTFACNGMLGRCSKTMIKDFTFADGTPFGIKEE